MAKLGWVERAEAEAIFEQGRGVVVGVLVVLSEWDSAVLQRSLVSDG